MPIKQNIIPIVVYKHKATHFIASTENTSRSTWAIYWQVLNYSFQIPTKL